MFLIIVSNDGLYVRFKQFKIYAIKIEKGLNNQLSK